MLSTAHMTKPEPPSGCPSLLGAVPTCPSRQQLFHSSCWSRGCLREEATDQGQGLGLTGITGFSPLLSVCLLHSLLSPQCPAQCLEHGRVSTTLLERTNARSWGLTFHYLGKLGVCQPQEAWLCLPSANHLEGINRVRSYFEFQAPWEEKFPSLVLFLI